MRRLRQELLVDLAPVDAGAIGGLPNTAGTQYEEFRIEVVLIDRQTGTSRASNLIAGAVTPQQRYEGDGRVRTNFADLTHPSSFARAHHAARPRCSRRRPPAERPTVDFYWLFSTDSTTGHGRLGSELSDLVSTLFARLENTTLDMRHGVTNKIEMNEGRLGDPPGWHRPRTEFTGAARTYAFDCTDEAPSNWWCYDPAGRRARHGLTVAYRGIRYMKGLATSQPAPDERIRSDAELVTIFPTSAAPRGTKQERDRAKRFLPKHTSVIAITPQSELRGEYGGIACGPALNNSPEEYDEVALKSGGAIFDLCAKDVSKIFRGLVEQVMAERAAFALPETPVPASLEVYLNDTWVPRSRRNGFDYMPSSNALTFFGKFRPEFDTNDGEAPDVLAVHYETYRQRCKAKANGKPSNCSTP